MLRDGLVSFRLEARNKAEKELRDILQVESSLRKQEQESLIASLEKDVLASVKGLVRPRLCPDEDSLVQEGSVLNKCVLDLKDLAAKS